MTSCTFSSHDQRVGPPAGTSTTAALCPWCRVRRVGLFEGQEPGGVFITGLDGFAVSSAIEGAAGSFGMLVTARTLPGAFGAILAPAALGTLVSTFQDLRDRGKAFGVFGWSPPAAAPWG